MPNAQWIDQLTAGSEVAYGHCKQTRPSFSFGKVKQISTQDNLIVLESGLKFNTDGKERGNAMFPTWLCSPQEARGLTKVYEEQVSLKDDPRHHRS